MWKKKRAEAKERARGCLITTKNHLIVSSKRVRAQELEFHSPCKSSNPRVESSGANREKKSSRKMSSWRIVSKYRNYSNQRNGMNRENKCELSGKTRAKVTALSWRKILNVHAKEEKFYLTFRDDTHAQQRIMCKIPFIFIIALMLFRCGWKNVFNTFFSLLRPFFFLR